MTASEDPKARRVRVANKIRIKASPLRMPVDDFNRMFRSPQVIPAASMREEIETATQQMFCDCCIKHVDIGTQAGAMEGTLLHVKIDEDPLRNFWKLAEVRCFSCGFTELVPLDTPDFSAPSNAGSLLGASSLTASVVSAPDPWAVAAKQHQARLEAEEKRNQQAAQINARNQQIQQLQNQLGRQHLDQLRQMSEMGMPQSMIEQYAKMKEQEKRLVEIKSQPPKKAMERLDDIFGSIFGGS